MQWFKHDTDASNDAKIRKLIMKHGAVGYAVYFHCLELAMADVGESNITFELEHDAEIIADNLKISGNSTEAGVDIVNSIMRTIIDLNLFQSSSGKIFCLKLLTRLDSSMTSNSIFRKKIKEAKENAPLIETSLSHDSVMMQSGHSHDTIMQEENKNRADIEVEKEKKEEKINKKEISNSQPFQPYNPNQNLHTMIQEMIDHWNKQPNLPKCRYQSITIPKLHEIIPKFDIFEEIEMYDSIVNLNQLWNDIDSRYRTSSFSNFYANDTIDSFVTSANPFERYEKPFNEDNMTKNESRAYTRYYIEKKNYCENWTDLREFMQTDYFIEYLKELIDE